MFGGHTLTDDSSKWPIDLGFQVTFLPMHGHSHAAEHLAGMMLMAGMGNAPWHVSCKTLCGFDWLQVMITWDSILFKPWLPA